MKWFAALKLILTLDCQHAMPLISQEMDRELSRPERWALRLHLLICRVCPRARRQLHYLRHQLSQLFKTHTPEHYQSAVLSPGARQSIAEALKSASDDSPPSSE